MNHITTDIRKFLNVPSITKQGWEAGFFDFGKALTAGTDFFNCGLLDRPDGLWLITRRAKWNVPDKLGYNDLVAFSMHRESLKLHEGFPIHMGKQWAIDHFEDPRAYYVDGKTYISACNFVRDNTGCTFPHQVICEVDDRWNLVKRYDPVYGHNGNDTHKNTKHEKNWTWFWIHGQPHLLYRIQPTVIARMTSPAYIGPATVWSKPWPGNPWPYGEIRGGTPPVLVGDRYFVFFHSSTPWLHGKNQYHMGAFSFDAAEPFEPRSITTEPLLSGSKQDVWAPNKPICVFPCGSLLRGGEWLVTLGVNDLCCGWAKIPHQKLIDQMIEL